MSNHTSQTTRPGGFFITGTDTDIGKSFVACCIAQGLLQQGFTVSPRKPIASGCILQDDGPLFSEDAHNLKIASQSPESLDQICRYRFAAPVSPARAISQSHHSINLDDLVSACDVSNNSFALVEGAGGFLSPLSADELGVCLNADLAARLNYPIILVVGNKLGCLNHALLTIEAIEARGLRLHTIVLNDLGETSDPQNFIELKNLTHHSVIHHAYQPQFSALIV